MIAFHLLFTTQDLQLSLTLTYFHVFLFRYPPWPRESHRLPVASEPWGPGECPAQVNQLGRLTVKTDGHRARK